VHTSLSKRTIGSLLPGAMLCFSWYCSASLHFPESCVPDVEATSSLLSVHLARPHILNSLCKCDAFLEWGTLELAATSAHAAS
jgi:hypothetical protein